MNLILFDNISDKNNLLPLTFTRPVALLRVGILTISEKWQKYFQAENASYITENYLQKKYPFIKNDWNQNFLINGSILPDKELFDAINSLRINQKLIHDNTLIAIKATNELAEEFSQNQEIKLTEKKYTQTVKKINFTWDIFSQNAQEIKADFNLITKNRESAEISTTNNILGRKNIFLEEGVKMEFATINAQNAFVYIGKDAEIMENSVVRGSLAMCEHAVLKLSAKIYGATTLGPYVKVGGEVNNSVITGYSSKAHDGFLGNSVLGEWCNLGADTNNSNLKNNYEEVKVWNYATERFMKTGLQFCGLIMGDHSKAGINTMFNTGTVVGVSANIFGSGFPRNIIPSFAWGGAGKFIEYKPLKAFQTAEKVMKRRGIVFDEIEKDLLQTVFEKTQKYRRF